MIWLLNKIVWNKYLVTEHRKRKMKMLLKVNEKGKHSMSKLMGYSKKGFRGKQLVPPSRNQKGK